MGKLKITPKGDREIVMTRVFDAPRKMVFDALSKPELVRHWLFAPPGWTFEVCDIDFRVGGKFRYFWRGPGIQMGIGGVYKEIVAPERIVATAKFDEAWYPGEELGTILLVEAAGKTTLTQTIRYDSKEARDMVLKSPMEQGVSAGYDNMEKMLAEQKRR